MITATMENSMEFPEKKLPYDPVIPLLCMNPEDMKLIY
jgi:hypothetical protein